MLDEWLDKKGLKYGDLTPEERQYATGLVNAIQTNALTIEKVREAIHGMKEAVERALVETDEFTYFLCFKWVNRKQVYLKARLQNYLLIEMLLSKPDKLKAQLDAGLNNIVSPVG